MAELIQQPKLKKSGFFTRENIFYVILFSAVLSGVGYAGYQKYYGTPQEKSLVIEHHTGEANPFLSGSLVKEKEPEPEVIEEEPVATPEPAKTVVQPSLPQAPPATDLIAEYSPSNQLELMREQLNNDRRGRIGIGSARGYGRAGNEYGYQMSQEDWPEEDKILASYPTRLDRTLTIDQYIPAAIVPELCSALNGKIVAKVTENVYATHGRKILIPMGSSAVGYYLSLSKIGQDRLQVFFVRLITPDGINIHLTNAEMADAMGRAGITGEMDNKLLEKYGLPLLMTTLQLGANYMFPVKDPSQRVLIEGYGSSVSNMGAKVLDETMQIKPVLTVPMASDILISPMKDIWFPKPKKMKIQAQPAEERNA